MVIAWYINVAQIYTQIRVMANFTPLGTTRRIPGAEPNEPTTTNTTTFVDAMGKPIQKQAISGACHKCGFAGHLPYQCRNNMPVHINGVEKSAVDVSSTSSDSSDDETPLTKEDKKLKKTSVKKLKKQLKRLKKKSKKSKKHDDSPDRKKRRKSKNK